MLKGRRSGATPVMSEPSTRTRPASSVSSPAMMRMRVVLPQPDGPSRLKNDPAGRSRVTSSTAVTAPKRLVTPSTRMAPPVVLARAVSGHRCCPIMALTPPLLRMKMAASPKATHGMSRRTTATALPVGSTTRRSLPTM